VALSLPLLPEPPFFLDACFEEAPTFPLRCRSLLLSPELALSEVEPPEVIEPPPEEEESEPDDPELLLLLELPGDPPEDDDDLEEEDVPEAPEEEEVEGLLRLFFLRLLLPSAFPGLAESVSSNSSASMKRWRTFGFFSCWVRVGRAWYTLGLGHSYVQCPTCMHFWQIWFPPPWDRELSRPR